jgi:DNA invertase Pin-like site-specific DNA recombinase
MIYGYARVSTKLQAKDGNSLEAQKKKLQAAGCNIIYADAFTGTKANRPELDKLLPQLKSGDMVVVTKLDRIARSVSQGIDLIDSLVEKGINVNVLNMGIMDNSPTGRLIRNVMLCFAEFERDMIMQRTQEGREIARLNPEYKEGRNNKYSAEQINHAMELLDGNYSYSQVVKMTGISKSTLIRARKKLAFTPINRAKSPIRNTHE